MSTEHNIGIGEGKPSSKVLKPPGGGSSDIFGFGYGTPQEKAKPLSRTEQQEGASAAPFATPTNVPEDPKQKRGQIYVSRNPITHEVIDYSDKVPKKTGVDVPTEPKDDEPKDKEEEKPQPSRTKKVPPGGASSLKFF